MARGGIAQAEYERRYRARWISRVGRKTVHDVWQAHELAIMLDMRSRGKTSGQIACRILRTPAAILAKLRVLREAAR